MHTHKHREDPHVHTKTHTDAMTHMHTRTHTQGLIMSDGIIFNYLLKADENR